MMVQPEYTKEQEEPKISFRQMNEFLAWFHDSYRETGDDGIYEFMGDGSCWNRKEIVQQFFDQFDIK
jgi:hypothetical protein